MANRTDPRVDAYIGRAAPFAQPILRHLRELIHTGCPDIEEDIKWGMPFVIHHGQPLCHFAAFKAHVAFGFWHQGMRKLLEQEGSKTEEAMGLMGRITQLSDLPPDRTMLRYFKAALALYDSGVSARPAAKPKPELPVPADLGAALKKNRPAAATWKKFSPSHRREYVEWLTEAKRDETRQKRLATTLEWLATGKSRNWKYQNC